MNFSFDNLKLYNSKYAHGNKIYTQSYIIATIQAVSKISMAKCPFYNECVYTFAHVFCSHFGSSHLFINSKLQSFLQSAAP